MSTDDQGVPDGEVPMADGEPTEKIHPKGCPCAHAFFVCLCVCVCMRAFVNTYNLGPACENSCPGTMLGPSDWGV